jgi:hypothetical protein
MLLSLIAGCCGLAEMGWMLKMGWLLMMGLPPPFIVIFV